MAPSLVPIYPGHGVGSLNLGASLHEVLSIVKEDREQFPTMDLHYSQAEPLNIPVVVSLPHNGIRLRFDGPEQQLRLIEIMDFKKMRLAYKGSELVKRQDDIPPSSSPAFRRIYQLFGASYPGEYLPPDHGSRDGTYILSWSGVAFTFPLQHSAFAVEKDHVSMLGSSAASPATHMALFEGNNWPEARKDLFVRIPNGPRVSALAERPKDSLPEEIDYAQIYTEGRVELHRRIPAQPFHIVLNETTPQDLTTELGPPDTTYKRNATSAAVEDPPRRRTGSTSRPVSNGRGNVGSQPSSYSSTGTDTFDADFDSGDADEDPLERSSRETFWNYFHHGMDILVGPPSETSSTTPAGSNSLASSATLVATKVVIHGNVPGSYAFNRHRRLRWEIALPDLEPAAYPTSETAFDHIRPALLNSFRDVWPAGEMGRGKVVNRTWGASPSDSSFFLPDAGEGGEDLVEGGGSEQWLGNTRLHDFPGLVFEVLENGAVGAVTVY